MSLDESVSGFIGRIYEAVYEPESWEAAVAELLCRTSSRVALVGITDNRSGGFQRNSFHGDICGSALDGIAEYNSELHSLDPTLAYLAGHPGGGLCRSRNMVVAGDYENDPFIVWNRSRFRSTDWIIAYAPLNADFSFGVSVHAPGGTGAHDERDVQLFGLLFSHFERAVRLAARPPDFSSHEDAALLVDEQLKVLALSPAAERLLTDADGLEIARGYLTSGCAPDAAALRRALGPHSSGALRVRRPSGKSDYLVRVTRCPARLEHLPTAFGAAIIRSTIRRTR